MAVEPIEYSCPYPPCTFRGSINSLWEHIRTSHPGLWGRLHREKTVRKAEAADEYRRLQREARTFELAVTYVELVPEKPEPFLVVRRRSYDVLEHPRWYRRVLFLAKMPWEEGVALVMDVGYRIVGSYRGREVEDSEIRRYVRHVPKVKVEAYEMLLEKYRKFLPPSAEIPYEKRVHAFLLTVNESMPVSLITAMVELDKGETLTSPEAIRELLGEEEVIEAPPPFEQLRYYPLEEEERLPKLLIGRVVSTLARLAKKDKVKSLRPLPDHVPSILGEMQYVAVKLLKPQGWILEILERAVPEKYVVWKPRERVVEGVLERYLS